MYTSYLFTTEHVIVHVHVHVHVFLANNKVLFGQGKKITKERAIDCDKLMQIVLDQNPHILGHCSTDSPQ